MGLKQPRIFKRKVERDEDTPTLKEVKENPELRKIFSLLVYNRMSVNSEEWFDLAESVFNNVEEIDPEVAEKIDKSRILERVQETQERVATFRYALDNTSTQTASRFDNLEGQRNVDILIEMAKSSHSGLKTLLNNLGEQGLIDYLRNENNVLSVVINNPKVIDTILLGIDDFAQIESKSRQRNVDFQGSIMGLMKAAFKEGTGTMRTTARGAYTFSSVLFDWVKGKNEQLKITAGNKRQAGVFGREEEKAKLGELRLNKQREKEQQARVLAYEQAQDTEAYRIEDLLVSAEPNDGETKLKFTTAIKTWFGRQLQKIEGVNEDRSEQRKLRKEAKEYGVHKSQERLAEFKRDSDIYYRGATIWADASFKEILDFGKNGFFGLKQIWKQNFLNFLNSESWDDLARSIFNSPAEVLGNLKKIEIRKKLSKASGKEFGQEFQNFKSHLKEVDLSKIESMPYEQRIQEKEKVERRLFVAFDEAGREPGYTDQFIKKDFVGSGWLDFISTPSNRDLRELVDSIRRHREEKFLSNQYLTGLVKNFINMNQEGELKKLGGATMGFGSKMGWDVTNWKFTPKQVEDFLIEQLRERYLKRLADRCLKECRVDIGNKGDAWRALGITVMRKKVQDKLKPHVDGLTY